MSDSEDVQSSSATTSRRSSYLTTSEDEDDVLNDETTGHVDGLVLHICSLLVFLSIAFLLIIYTNYKDL